MRRPGAVELRAFESKVVQPEVVVAAQNQIRCCCVVAALESAAAAVESAVAAVVEFVAVGTADFAVDSGIA